VRRDEYDAMIEELRADQDAVWGPAKKKWLRFRSCQLGLCEVLDSAEYAARTAEEGPERDKKVQYVARLRAQNEQPWTLAARDIEQIEMAIKRLEKKRDGLL